MACQIEACDVRFVPESDGMRGSAAGGLSRPCIACKNGCLNHIVLKKGDRAVCAVCFLHRLEDGGAP